MPDVKLKQQPSGSSMNKHEIKPKSRNTFSNLCRLTAVIAFSGLAVSLMVHSTLTSVDGLAA